MTLSENGCIITDDQSICTVFNDFFINNIIAKDIGTTVCPTDYNSHPSIMAIRQHTDNIIPTFSFTSVNNGDVYEHIMHLNCNKPCCWDDIPPKILKLSAEINTEPMNPRLLLAKCEAYGMCESSVLLLESYFTGRQQRVKSGCINQSMA